MFFCGSLILRAGVWAVVAIYLFRTVRRGKSLQSIGRGQLIFLGLIISPFILTVLYTLALIIITLDILKYGVIVSLPGGIAAQEMAADSLALPNVMDQISAWVGSIVVSPSTYLRTLG